ncbi:unnamed protein product [Rotaria sordida]|uniref:Copper type II ascorbate-dependent monooxygenase C-terminal domain-containing protein n=1 Tax=Rotaria sordida TaxID=392033 RepID=A0A815JZC6_9BILA|nr:unnamed protein product [Rotaria sordida]
MHDNYDNSGIRYYIGNELRKYDLGYLTFAVHESSAGIAIPPVVNQFEIDAYCPVNFSQSDSFVTRCVYDTMNKSGITLGGQRTKDEMCCHSFTLLFSNK